MVAGAGQMLEASAPILRETARPSTLLRFGQDGGFSGYRCGRQAAAMIPRQRSAN